MDRPDPSAVPDQHAAWEEPQFSSEITEACEVECVRLAVRPDDVVIEGGGGKGTVAAVLSSIAKLVVVFEPNPSLHADLRKLPIILRPEALGTDYRLARFHVREWYANSSLDANADPSIPGSATVDTIFVPVVELSSMIHVFKANVLVLDVEGAEFGLLYESDLSKIRTVVVEVHGLESAPFLFEHMEKRGFKVEWLGRIEHDRVQVVWWER